MKIISVFSASLLLTLFAGPAVAAQKPNIILVMPDDRWWTDVQPLLVNENITDIPKINLLKDLYWKQFGGGPDEAMLRKMDPTNDAGGEANGNPNKKAEPRKRRAGAPEDVRK